jgi:hypothetical protein
LLQNLEPAGSEAPQEAQVKTRRAPHPRQKFDSDGLTCWQLGHVMLATSQRACWRRSEPGSASLVRRGQAIKSAHRLKSSVTERDLVAMRPAACHKTAAAPATSGP